MTRLIKNVTADYRSFKTRGQTMFTGPISLILSILVIFSLFRVARGVKFIPTVEKQRIEARRIFNLRVFKDEKETRSQLAAYFKKVKKQQRILAIDLLVVLALVIGARYFISKTIELPSRSLILSTALVFVFIGFGLLMIVGMFRSTDELIKDEYNFLSDHF